MYRMIRNSGREGDLPIRKIDGEKGDALGIMGNTGLSKGAHTHFEIRKPDGKTRLNPAEFLRIANAFLESVGMDTLFILKLKMVSGR